ncbi:DUF5908 family protein [Planctomycetota bacterium]
MPVEIKELIIRAVVEQDRESTQDAPSLRTTNDEKQALLEACVKQVLRILKRSKER